VGYGNGYAPAQGAATAVTGAAVTGASPPTAGYGAGATTLTLTGAALGSATGVTLGGVVCAFSVVDSETITVTVPWSDQAAGAKDVVVTTPLAAVSVTYTPALWTPAEITTALWLDASDLSSITASCGRVSQLDDLSGNNRHATQSSASLQPVTGTRTQGGRNALDFGNKAYRMDVPASAGNPWSFAYVGYNDGSAGTGWWFYGNGSGGGNIWMVHNDAGQSGKATVYAGDHVHSATTVASPAAIMVTGNTGTGTDGLVSLNGGTAGTGNTGTNTPNGSPDLGGSSSYGTNGLICEVVFADGVWSTADRQMAEGYLAHKWNITLPGGHPYAAAAPTV